MYAINMGYLDPKASQPGDSVAWHPDENSFEHPWALERRLFNYGYYRQNEVFGDVMQFLHAPADLVDLITSKIAEGAAKRSQDDERLIPKIKPPAGLSQEEMKALTKHQK